MIDRQHPRALYDLFRFRKAPLSYDSELMRKLAVLLGSTLNRDLRSYNMSRFAGIDEEAIKRLLCPLLVSDEIIAVWRSALMLCPAQRKDSDRRKFFSAP
jgi:hypothetical protein